MPRTGNPTLKSKANIPSTSSKFSPMTTRANFRKIDGNIPKDADYNVELPIAMVFEVNEGLMNSLYG